MSDKAEHPLVACWLVPTKDVEPNAGKVFRDLRTEQGLGLRQASKLAVGRGFRLLTVNRMGGLERGETKNADPGVLREMADFYKLPYEDLASRFLREKYRIDLTSHGGEGTSHPHQEGVLMSQRHTVAPSVPRMFGDNLKRLRERTGLNVESLGILLRLNHPHEIAQWETERKHMISKPEMIVKIAKALHCEPWELLEGVETEYDKLRRTAPVMSVKEDRTEGGSNIPSSYAADTRVRELDEKYRSILSVTQDVALRLTKALQAHGQLGSGR